MVERAILVIGSGIFVGILGMLIKYAGMMHLIAGYEPAQVADEEGLANFIGVNTLYVAVLTVCVGVLEFWKPTADSAWYWGLFGIAIVAIAVRMLRGARHYESPSEHNRTD
ncbi:DUF3784 domain-containing protein [Halobacterium sp. KA-4]|uniref:DUF3784 domain-containing protein n=1 Tax=Halobacterium sp. KA-4 TaxID=2896367 RepID=UPI001E34FB96|nr:DUF3784 domain-containing protein [Halobacterium sp. KA-4]MCD2200985.1 DUF3784 domain-containing protein [Halobacterium sp. KA-4]